ncbi:MAG: DUF3048 C-terminal domain-containing protein [Christensenellaceae bacterium]
MKVGMKKGLFLVLAIVMALTLFIGCSDKEEAPEETPTQVSSVEEAPAEEPAEEIPEEPEEQGYIPENMSPTTGLTDTTTVYKPVIVQIGNEPDERPQTGIQSADVVYETNIEGIDSRFTCVFNDIIHKADAPDSFDVGPVRSSRYYHQWIQGEWDALYVHMGGPDKTNNPDSDIWGASGEHIKQRINGAGKGAVNSNMFSPLRSGVSIEKYAATDIIEDVGIYNYEPTEREPFKYYPEESYADEKEIAEINLSFLQSPGWVSYKYDADKDKLLRYMNGNEHKDLNTGEAVEVQNLIVQYTGVALMENDLGRQRINMFGAGPCEFIIHGKHLRGTWERATNSDSTKYYLESGEEVTFTPGNTWIAVHPNTKNITIEYADGTEYDSAE